MPKPNPTWADLARLEEKRRWREQLQQQQHEAEQRWQQQQKRDADVTSNG
jgi:hypothetical protein